uniref:Uncharacterized protein n=1 Tax=Anguilla anguilla TaxID=7936 RepID=A0A0E9Q3H8_ANGAN
MSGGVTDRNQPLCGQVQITTKGDKGVFC